MSNTELITCQEVLRLTGIRSRSTIWRKMRKGGFPHPVDIGGGRIRWRAADISDWINALPLRRYWPPQLAGQWPAESISTMSIYSMLKAALRAQGWILARVPEDDELHAAELVDLLTEDNVDGRARRFALAPWLTFERPVIARFQGETCILTIEGPIYLKDGFGYPLGSQMQTEFGWLALAPVETGQLIDELRAAIDLVLMLWFTDPAMVPRQTSSRQPRERFFDDHLARTQIRLATPPVRHEEQAADDH